MENQISFPPVLQDVLRQMEAHVDAELLTRQQTDNIKDPLYHYTDTGGLLGIIQNQQVWFTHHQHLNDPSELTFGMKVARSLLNEIGGTASSPRQLFCSCVADILCPENFHSNIEFYIASFSHKRDDLGQWRAYGANGRGYALGLAPKLFNVEAKLNLMPHEKVFMSEVVYGEQEARKLFRASIEKAVALVESAAQDDSRVMANQSIGWPFLREMTDILISGALLPASLIIKHEAYEHEKEVRLMIIGVEPTLKPFVATRTRGDEIVPFIRSDMAVQNDGIVEIVTGPAIEPVAVAGLKTFLRLHALDSKTLVQPSGIPYRPI